MLTTIKEQLSEVIKERSKTLIELVHSNLNPEIVSDEIDTIRKLKDAYDKLDEVS